MKDEDVNLEEIEESERGSRVVSMTTDEHTEGFVDVVESPLGGDGDGVLCGSADVVAVVISRVSVHAV